MSEQLLTWQEIEEVVKHNRVTALMGLSSTGKSYVGREFPECVYLTPETCAAELLGHYIATREGGDVWVPGPVIRAWTANGGKGCGIVINEIGEAGGDALSALLVALDSEETARLSTPNGLVKPGPNFKALCTSNASLDSLTPALQSRLAVCVHIDQVHPDALAKLDQSLRQAAQHDIESGIRTLRHWQAYQRLCEAISPEVAAKAVFGEQHADMTAAIQQLNNVRE